MTETITLTIPHAYRVVSALATAEVLTFISHECRDLGQTLRQAIALAESALVAVPEPAANIEVERDVPLISIAVIGFDRGKPLHLGALDCYQAPGERETLTVDNRRWRVTQVHWVSGRVAEVYVEPPADGWDGGGF